MVVKSNSVVSIYDSKSAQEIMSFQVPNLVAASLSPRGIFLQTFQKTCAARKECDVVENGDG